ncbi:MAG: hypothetical protein M4D80_11630 [Myxococcota bacterium]|nr:hypothetical protein [Deltaproteobacteria bacterium]MDQ3335810.1 hypothetical protein [Myxococcota bacterium]
MRALVLVMLLSSTAHAEDDVFFYGAAHLGLNLPVGAVGGELGVGLDWMRASAGVGRGFRGVSMAAMVRAVGEMSGMDIGIGLGISRGPGLHDTNISLGEGDPDQEPDTHFGDATRWLDLQVSFEFAISDHSFMRLTAGMTHAFDIDCESEDKDIGGTVCDSMQRNELEASSYSPYLGIAGGIRFPEAPSSKPRHTIPVGPPRYPILVDPL